MATSVSFIQYVCEQLNGIGSIRYRKMFGEYMVYVNDKPVVIVCNDTAYVKMLEEIQEIMKDSKTGYPYEGAKEHYILDIDDSSFSKIVVNKIEEVTTLPKKRKKD